MIVPACQTAVCLLMAIAGTVQGGTAVPPVGDMPIYATAYNWEWGGLNCDENCQVTAIGVETSPELLGHTAACPADWLGRITTTVVTLPDGSEWWCIDTFGDEANRRPLLFDHPYYGLQWVIRMDFAVSDPLAFGHNQELLYGWSTEWREVRELKGE